MKEQLAKIRAEALEALEGAKASADLDACGSSTWAKRAS